MQLLALAQAQIDLHPAALEKNLERDQGQAALLDTPEDVVEIFIRANAGGTKLGKSDLMFSLLASDWTVADLGCGTGQVVAELAPFVDRVIGGLSALITEGDTWREDLRCSIGHYSRMRLESYAIVRMQSPISNPSRLR